MKASWLRSFLPLFLLLSGLMAGLTGCKTAESENVSSRPWNTPRGYDTGLPGMDNFQRR
jgi:hypothetical protein